MKKVKRLISALLALCLCLALCACSSGAGEAAESPEVEGTAEENPAAEAAQAADTEAAAETRIFTDSAGRDVEIPADIERIIPSGDMAMMFIWPLAADKLVSVARTPTELQAKYFGGKTNGLPETGNLYKTGDQLNLEEVASLNADIIIDFGEAKDDIASDLDGLQELLGIPCVFISGSLEDSADSYRMLGELLNMPDEAEALAVYIEKVIGTAQEVFKTVEKKDAVVLNGSDSLGCVASGTYFDEIWAYMLNNIAVVEESQMYAATSIDFEQLAEWNPEYIFFYNGAEPENIAEDEVWAELSAVKDGKYYSVPAGPYSFVSPPSINRYLAIVWLSEILYPGEFGWDAKEMTQEFYKLFYLYELDDAGYEELLSTTD